MGNLRIVPDLAEPYRSARVSRLPNTLFTATLPAALVGIYNLGTQVTSRPLDPTSAWQLALLERLGLEPAESSLAHALLLGAAFLMPLLLTALLVSRAWAEAFARWRRQPVDRGWFVAAWLYSLLLPATLPLHFAALGLSFGLLFGCYAFGGSSRYIVNPALLGVIFLTIGYPQLMSETQWLPGTNTPSTRAAIMADSTAALDDRNWLLAFLGREIGALGTTSAAACLLGALWLLTRRAASWRILLAGCVGLTLAGTLGGTLPWDWHFALGNFAFALAFIATDPTTQPRTNGGSVMFGALFGALTVVLRVANPEHPEGTWPALLLAALCIPLLDQIQSSTAARWRRPPATTHD
jgi:Na+-transporting NADH:ubiquinone oxidoreductase subunit B